MCDNACAKYWPPLTSSDTPHVGEGLKASLLRLGAAARGGRQVPYAGHPLYTFVGDTRPGRTNGQELDQFGAEWYVVGPSGRKVEGRRSRGSGSGDGAHTTSSGGW